MKKLYDDDEDESPGMEKAKILVTVIPFVLIILILAVTLLVNSGKKDKDKSEDLQQSIMDYADENKGAENTGSEVPVNSSSAVTGNGEGDEGTEEPEETPSPSPDAAAGTPSPDVSKTGEGTPGMGAESNMPSPTPAKRAVKKDYSKIQFHKEEQLKDMMAYWEDNNQKALDDLVYLDHYIAMSWSLRKTSNFYYYGDTDGSGRPNGKGIAVYADNQYYYGDWKNGVRSGNGTWIHYHMQLDDNAEDIYTYHQYTGGWANDLPEGEGSEHYDYDMSLLKGNDVYITNLIGSYSAGFIQGEFYLTSIYADGRYMEWNAEADQGAWVYRSENKDKNGNRTVYVDVSNPDNYVWMQPKDNANIGVRCLISKNLKNSQNP